MISCAGGNDVLDGIDVKDDELSWVRERMMYWPGGLLFTVPKFAKLFP
jgi:hypothetical protein